MRALVLVLLCTLSWPLLAQVPEQVLPGPERLRAGDVPVSEPVAPVPADPAWTIPLLPAFGLADAFHSKFVLTAGVRRAFGRWVSVATPWAAFSWTNAALGLVLVACARHRARAVGGNPRTTRLAGRNRRRVSRGRREAATTVGVTLWLRRAVRNAASSWPTIVRTPSTSAPAGGVLELGGEGVQGDEAYAGKVGHVRVHVTRAGPGRPRRAAGRRSRRAATASTPISTPVGAGAGDEHVDRAGVRRQVGERDRRGVVLAGEAGGALGRPVGHRDRGGAGAGRGGGGEPGHRPGADDHDVLAGEGADVRRRPGRGRR